MSVLLSTLLSLPDDRRAAAERELVLLARASAVGELAGDIAHDIANPVHGVIGLVDLLREDVTAGSLEEEHLRLLRQSALELKRSVRLLQDHARAPTDEPERASLDEAARVAVALWQHGPGRVPAVEERYPESPVVVPCPRDLLVQAVLQLLLAGRGAERVLLEVDGARLRVAPAPEESLRVVIAQRIAADHGAAVARDADSLSLVWA